MVLGACVCCRVVTIFEGVYAGVTKMCINGPDHFTGEGPLTIATVCVLPLKLYQISTVELPSLADRYCQRAVATGRSRQRSPPFTRPSAVGAQRRPLGVTVGRSPKSVLLNQSDSAMGEPVGCWPLANVRELMQSGEHSCTGNRFRA